MSDEAPPRHNGKQSLPEADLDAALWPDAPAPPRSATEAQPISTVPEPRSVKATISADKTQRPGSSALIAEAPPAPSKRQEQPASADRLADTMPLNPVSASRPVVSKPRTMPARDRLLRERERQARRRRRTRWSVAAAVIVVLLAGAAVGTALLRQSRAPRMVQLEYAGPYAPVTLNVDNSVTMARPGVTGPVVDVYEDFQCRACRAFETTNGGMLERLADRGQVKVVYYPFTIFTSQPAQANSVRAWAAARCAPPSRWAKYHNALYANQPAETAVDGFSVGLLIRLGKKAGITSPVFAQCVRSQLYAMQNAPLSDQIMNGGVSRMPTLTLNGRVLHINPTSPGLRKQILAQS